MPVLVPYYVPTDVAPIDWYRPPFRVEWERDDLPELGEHSKLTARPYERSDEVDSSARVPTTRAIREAILGSRWILELTDGWDGEGSLGYARETWERATQLLLKLAQAAVKIGRVLPVADISPADAGSIDLFWRDSDRSLLVNIPATRDNTGSFFGQDQNGNTISGTFSGESVRLDLAAWISASYSD